MADTETRVAPVIDIVRRGDDVVIRAEVRDMRPEDVRVSVSDGWLEMRVPGSGLVGRAPVRAEGTGGAGEGARTPTGDAGATRRARDTDAEPPVSVPDERDLWNAQKPLISEDRRTSIHLEGYSDEQANDIMEALGDDAAEEAQGGSSTGSDVIAEHGGFPPRRGEEEEEPS